MRNITVEKRVKVIRGARCTMKSCRKLVKVPKHGLCVNHYNDAKKYGRITVDHRSSHVTDFNAPCSYDAAIQRVRIRRGSAKQQQCIRCEGKAQVWTYIPGTSEHEQQQPDTRPDRHGRFIYSGDPADWVPACINCRTAMREENAA